MAIKKLSIDLIKTDAARLASLEKTVEKGKHAFVEVGNALKEIRDSKLYKTSHGTFANYVEDRFGFQRAHAYRLIESADDPAKMSPIGDKIKTESQAREVAKAPPERQNEVVEKAIEIAAEQGKKPTAEIMKQAREAVMGETSTVTADMADEEPTEAYEDVEEAEESPPAKPMPTVAERASLHKTAIRSHNAQMMRIVDELNAVKPDAKSHATIHGSFRAIDAAVGGWK